MKITTPHCPVCGELAVATIETLPGRALLNLEEDGTAEYAGETEIDWNGQKSVRDKDGNRILCCDNGHEWPSEVLEGE